MRVSQGLKLSWLFSKKRYSLKDYGRQGEEAPGGGVVCAAPGFSPGTFHADFGNMFLRYIRRSLFLNPYCTGNFRFVFSEVMQIGAGVENNLFTIFVSFVAGKPRMWDFCRKNNPLKLLTANC